MYEKVSQALTQETYKNEAEILSNPKIQFKVVNFKNILVFKLQCIR